MHTLHDAILLQLVFGDSADTSGSEIRVSWLYAAETAEFFVARL
jgi:hypothetical protein